MRGVCINDVNPINLHLTVGKAYDLWDQGSSYGIIVINDIGSKEVVWKPRFQILPEIEPIKKIKKLKLT